MALESYEQDATFLFTKFSQITYSLAADLNLLSAVFSGGLQMIFSAIFQMVYPNDTSDILLKKCHQGATFSSRPFSPIC